LKLTLQKKIIHLLSINEYELKHIMKDYWNFNFSRQEGRILHGENEYRIWRDKIKGEWLWDNNQ